MIERVSNFKERFNQALNIKNIKAVELSKKTGITEAQISQYRSGYAKPKDDLLFDIAQALDVNPVWLLGLNVSIDPPPENFEIADDGTVISPEDRELLNRYHNASPEDRAIVDLALKRSQQKP